jgi:hypothetical protein
MTEADQIVASKKELANRGRPHMTMTISEGRAPQALDPRLELGVNRKPHRKYKSDDYPSISSWSRISTLA